ncbi:hypothetical protein B296_00011932 [Ensete ventricosum]|uniref:Uncharacterized protein n=1 Tax=Ensete ventricosum TaxID=4639 RepID=A0A427B8P2_ENSVE|nr:hypothetical protein B296_00011932 [Ensete ventricosum]
MSTARRGGERATTIAALRHGQRLLAALAESKDIALDLAKGCMAESNMGVASHVAKSLGYMGNYDGPGFLAVRGSPTATDSRLQGVFGQLGFAGRPW